MPRLNQVTKELNIGYHTAADFVRTRFRRGGYAIRRL